MSDQSMIDPTLSGLPGSQIHLQRVVSQRGNVGDDGPYHQPLESVVPQTEDDILRNYGLAVARAQTWTGLARFGFNAMLASSEYKNKLRLRPEKMERIIHFLTTPGAKSREKDRADAQVKHQAQQWLYHNGILYRKESRLEHPRRHVSAQEVFDILTAEHLMSHHHGRDKMLKVLESKYIGYTKDELMYIIDHCLICTSKHIRGAAARRREHRNAGELENEAGADGPLHEMTSSIAENACTTFTLTSADSDMMANIPDDTDKANYVGAAMFWMYIIAALLLSAKVISTVINITPTPIDGQKLSKKSMILFSALAAISFLSLSVNMLNVLIESFSSWSKHRPSTALSNIISRIWKWSITSTLFREFAEAVVKSNARYLWTEAALLVTFYISLYMGIEGIRRRVPNLWAFFVLAQILPVSFTQNLFYLTLLRSSKSSWEEPIRHNTFIGFVTLYCGCLFLLPLYAKDTSLISSIIFTRILLFAPYVLASNSKIKREGGVVAVEHRVDEREWAKVALGFASLTLLIQLWFTLLDMRDFGKIVEAAFEHPAVSTLGCDFVISVASLIAWSWTQQRQHSDREQKEDGWSLR